MTITWPSELPQHLLRDGFSKKSPDNLIASEVSIGPAKVRRRTTAAVTPISGSLIMTDAQLDQFEDFVENDIAQRSKAFNFPDPRSGSPMLVRMTSAYMVEFLGQDWKVSISLEVLP